MFQHCSNGFTCWPASRTRLSITVPCCAARTDDESVTMARVKPDSGRNKGRPSRSGQRSLLRYAAPMPQLSLDPLVSTSWLAAELGAPGLVVLDASWYLPALNREPREEF